MTEPLLPQLLTTFDFRCPYCRHANAARLLKATADSLTRTGRTDFRELVTCDSEDGGCDNDFAIRVEATLNFDVQAYALAGLVGLEVEPAHDSDGEPTAAALATNRPDPDLRLWEVTVRHADEPEGNSTEYLNAEQVAARAAREPLFAYALTFGDGDHLKAVSPDNLSEVVIRCQAPELPARFDSFALARRQARRDALSLGSPVEIYFDGEGSFRLYATTPLPVPPPPADFELIQTVEVPVLFKIQTVRDPEEIHAPAGWFVAEVLCDDERANPDLQSHGNSEIYRTAAFPVATEAATAAAHFIRSEFVTLDAEIQSDAEIDDDIQF